LKGQNDAMLDQFTLGQKSGSKDATRLPVGLALALLRDRHGKISLDIRWRATRRSALRDRQGHHPGTDQPGDASRHVSFALLGKLVPGGGGDEALGAIVFAPGVDTLGADQADKLGKIVNALGERPR
jgi:hypothetical protein